MTFPTFTLLIKKPILLIATTPIVAATVYVIDIKSAAWILLGFFFVDLATGLLGSYFEWSTKPNKKDKYFFGRGEGFSSDKFKKMGIKGLVYCGLPYMLLKFQIAFMIKNFKYEKVSDAEFTLPVIFIIFFIINEGFSIFHENLPKCGFNLYDRIRKIVKTVKTVKKDFTED